MSKAEWQAKCMKQYFAAHKRGWYAIAALFLDLYDKYYDVTARARGLLEGA